MAPKKMQMASFDINGRYLLKFGKYGSGDGELSNPVGITVYADREFIAELSENHRISVFQPFYPHYWVRSVKLSLRRSSHQ